MQESEVVKIKEPETTFCLDVPQFISELPKIDPQDACNLARELALPLVTGTDEETDTHIGLLF
ncbi:MAG: hypothetical protein GW762_02355 [Candidatus Pacebacteria bacterium]|nr:hypothetical protein [Candidatus Paceibacterota bacterium]PIR63596.1 MAG: hypothetical protein COU64_03295 [Candidatus Pacebacteria bacterium CG10_big_fil_rev_8_21_14_0_10_40_26]PIZ78698.1 MAG: hypothetical protein COY01_03665 [Candidatus Pacebacteria bacterium CG_4_10_14_0_2_um_filter_40_20]PJA68450.1 MAG: hypothetical protein CO156_05650 [Candidatus Pacebacteria bacterium CG_4_9_14_3_um_filter_40_12]PJC41312.1 MAG: hypothetical protein CO041_05720 [Candidatus Pacebacteria bacterium CG_4_9_